MPNTIPIIGKALFTDWAIQNGVFEMKFLGMTNGRLLMLGRK